MRQIGPKNRIARREGMDLGLKTPGSKSHARLLKKLNVPPGQHGSGRKRKKTSEHGMQLREKQKLRFIYGVNEKQLKKYFKKASEKRGNTAIYLADHLESRLDNIVFRLGFTPTRASARQLVCHGNIKVNNRVLDIPSAQLKMNDIVSIADEKATKIPYVEKNLANKEIIIPKWLEKKGSSGKLINNPSSEDMQKQINLRLIVEFYSR
jgi:small subunit ribosomal protein S4